MLHFSNFIQYRIILLIKLIDSKELIIKNSFDIDDFVDKFVLFVRSNSSLGYL